MKPFQRHKTVRYIISRREVFEYERDKIPRFLCSSSQTETFLNVTVMPEMHFSSQQLNSLLPANGCNVNCPPLENKQFPL
jgi:hypothetical protein